MINTLAIFSKDVRSYFSSMTAYVVITVFLGLSGFFFSAAVSYFSFYSIQLSAQPYMAAQGLNLTEAVIGNLFFNFSVILLLMMPLLSMRVLSEEYRQGTYELLLTYPVSELEVVLGKFLAAYAVFAVMVCPVFFQLVLLKAVGGEFEWTVVGSAFLGLFLLGLAFLALGIFASSLTENQIVSAVITFGFLLFLWVIGWLAEFAPPGATVWFEEISLIRHAEDFFKGILQLKHIWFYLCFAFFFLCLTIWKLESRRWVK